MVGQGSKWIGANKKEMVGRTPIGNGRTWEQKISKPVCRAVSSRRARGTNGGGSASHTVYG